MRIRDGEHDLDHNCNWGGMALEAEEYWRNALTGRFSIKRKNGIAKDPSKLPHQRIHIRPDFGGGPMLNIHKHSMANLFSINRQHKMKNKDMKLTMFIIPLGQRSVQSTYTSTLFTRKLKTQDPTVVPPNAVAQIEKELEAEEYDVRSPLVTAPHRIYGPIPPGGLGRVLLSKLERLNASLMEFDDAFYMLLPLWPGSTDDASAIKHPFVVPNIPLKKRQYLLVFYKPLESTGKGKQHDGKKDSPMPSRSYVRGNRTLILTSFHISARIVLYKQLPGSGLHIPEEGLPVAGPLKEAYDSMPSLHEFKKGAGSKDRDVVIGFCSSRDGGIQFERHRFLELGLCRAIKPPPYELFEGEDMPSELIFTPTPIGLAVLETIWAGCIALTSFRPAS